MAAIAAETALTLGESALSGLEAGETAAASSTSAGNYISTMGGRLNIPTNPTLPQAILYGAAIPSAAYAVGRAGQFVLGAIHTAGEVVRDVGEGFKSFVEGGEELARGIHTTVEKGQVLIDTVHDVHGNLTNAAQKAYNGDLEGTANALSAASAGTKQLIAPSTSTGMSNQLYPPKVKNPLVAAPAKPNNIDAPLQGKQGNVLSTTKDAPQPHFPKVAPTSTPGSLQNSTASSSMVRSAVAGTAAPPSTPTPPVAPPGAAVASSNAPAPVVAPVASQLPGAAFGF